MLLLDTAMAESIRSGGRGFEPWYICGSCWGEGCCSVADLTLELRGVELVRNAA